MGRRRSKSAEFDAVVEEALAEIPAAFRPYLENLQVAGEPRPSPKLLREMGLAPDETFYGLYLGTPLTERGAETPLYPDRIVLYREPLLEDFGRDPAELRRQIRLTVIHEIGHHFGLDDGRMEEYEED